MSKPYLISIVLTLAFIASCKSPVKSSSSEPGLTGTYWKLTEVGGKTFQIDSTYQREPHMILHPDGNRVSGSGGCNSMGGSFETDMKSVLTFSKVISTKMMCQEMEIEDAFFKVLNNTHRFSITDNTLVLSDDSGKLLAKFTPVYLK